MGAGGRSGPADCGGGADVGGHPNGVPEEILTGCVTSNGDALGRPVGVAIDQHGALRVADDVGNSVWRVTPATKP